MLETQITNTDIHTLQTQYKQQPVMNNCEDAEFTLSSQTGNE